ncbi:MAG: Ppx/GppA family phosphatase [Alphaproteobacteria bacterium]|nr:Ppx/GppA family phosphatase [Alphaproteobacteria bacterium]
MPLPHSDIAVMDVGSNSVRLVIYRHVGSTWQAIFNEKASCALGRNLVTTGLLDPKGRAKALQTLKRFALLAKAFQVERTVALATAAVREAADGAAFVDEVRATIGLELTVLSGFEEGRYSGLGVLAFAPDAHGICGDLGGSSLELTEVSGGSLGQSVSLPLGVLALLSLNSKNTSPLKAADTIRDHLRALPHYFGSAQPAFYAVGGSWRALANVHQQFNTYPLDHVHYYTVPAEALLKTAERILSTDEKELAALHGISKSRAATLPLATILLTEICRYFTADSVVFSSNGIRDGYLFGLQQHPGVQDPLLDELHAYANAARLFQDNSPALLAWLAPVLALAPLRLNRPAQLLAIVSDSARKEHPDHRAELAYTKLLYAPFTAITHPGRAQLALSMYIRHAGKVDKRRCAAALHILDKQAQADALLLGSAMRLAKALAGGMDNLLSAVPFVQKNNTWGIDYRDTSVLCSSELVEKRLAEFNTVTENWRKMAA